MPLTAPTNIELTNLRRVPVARGSVVDPVSRREQAAVSEIQFFADVRWTNSEASVHNVEVDVAFAPLVILRTLTPRFTLARRANELKNVMVANFFAAETTGDIKTVTITVRIKSLTEQVSTQFTRQMSLAESATYTGGFSYDDAGGGLNGTAMAGALSVPSAYTGVIETAGRDQAGFYQASRIADLSITGFALNPFNGELHNLEPISGALIRSDGLQATTLQLRAVIQSFSARVVEFGPSVTGGGLSDVAGKITAALLAPGVRGFAARGANGRRSNGYNGLASAQIPPLTPILTQLVDGGLFTATLVLRSPSTPTRATYNVVTEFAFPQFTTEDAATTFADLIGGRVIPPGLPVSTRRPITTFEQTTDEFVRGIFTREVPDPDRNLRSEFNFVVVSGSRLRVFENTTSAETFTTVFTYFRNGLATPRITSLRNLATFIDYDIDYNIVADDVAATFSVEIPAALDGQITFSAPNKLTGTVTEPGVHTIPVTATNSLGARVTNIVLTVQPFTVFDEAITLTRNETARIPLKASHQATFTWANGAFPTFNGAPHGFALENSPVSFGTAEGPDQVFLVGTPVVNGGQVNSITGTRVGFPDQTSMANIAITVRDPLPVTVITGNSEILRSGVSAQAGSNVNVALSAVPMALNWNSAGLPPGLVGAVRSDGFFIINGIPTEPGEYFAAITAQALGNQVSSALNLRFNITPVPPPPPRTGETAIQRSPWLTLQWELLDLHVRLRERTVDSSLFEAGGRLRVKLGDALDFAIFFVDQNSAVVDLAPTQLRMTIRLADNLDDLIIFKSATPPVSQTQERQTYYLMPVTTGSRERDIALEWAEANGKNEPLQCVADIEWTYEGKVYSSRTFPVSLELDVTRP